jgi:integrase
MPIRGFDRLADGEGAMHHSLCSWPSSEVSARQPGVRRRLANSSSSPPTPANPAAVATFVRTAAARSPPRTRRGLQRKLGRIVPYLFPHLNGRRPGQARRGFSKRWETICKETDVHGRLLHDVRRTAVRNLDRVGVARSVAMKIIGQQTESVYGRYAIMSDADLQDTSRKLAGTFPGTSSAPTLDSHALTTQNS